jgi:hypothetical protein
MFKGISLLVIILGIIIEQISSMIGRFLLVFILVKTIPTNVHNATNLIYSSIIFLIIAMIITLFFCWYGGYITARIAKSAKMKNALIVSLFFEFFIFNPFIGHTNFPNWYMIILLILNIPVTVIGVRMVNRKTVGTLIE